MNNSVPRKQNKTHSHRQQTELRIHYCPRHKDNVFSSHLHNTSVYAPCFDGYPFVVFKITNGNTHKSAQFTTDDQGVGRIIDLQDAEKDGTLSKHALNVHKIKERNKLSDRYSHDLIPVEGQQNLFAHTDPRFFAELETINSIGKEFIEQSTQHWLLLDLRASRFSADLGSDRIIDAKMTISYQWNKRNNERSKKPWRIDIYQYPSTSKEKHLFIELSSNEFNSKINEIVYEMCH